MHNTHLRENGVLGALALVKGLDLGVGAGLLACMGVVFGLVWVWIWGQASMKTIRRPNKQMHARRTAELVARESQNLKPLL